MCPNQKALIFAGSLFIATLTVAEGNGMREIEVKPDPPGAEKQIFTVRFAPDETTLYSQMVFECALQQELALLTPDGGKTNKIYDAGRFTSRHRDIKMIKDVDCYVSFFVQLGSQRPCDMAGDVKFITNAPVTVARIKITAYRAGKAAWTVNTNAKGKYYREQGAGSNRVNAVWKTKE